MTHYHATADRHEVVICHEHASPGRLALLDNSDGHAAAMPRKKPEPCESPACYWKQCWIGEINAIAYARTGSRAYWTLPCTPPAIPF